MSPEKQPTPPMPAAVMASRRWKALRDAAAPMMSAPALAIALLLLLSLVLAMICQFGSTLYDARPDLSYLHAALNAVLATALAVLMLLRPRWDRAHVVVLAVSAAILLTTLWSVGAKLQYRRGLLGDSFYSLPHQAFRYEAPAETVWLRTSDGVQLAATQIIRAKHTRAIVIYPSWRTNRDAFSLATMAQWLSNDVDVLVVDPRGQGESEGAKSPDGQEKQDVLAGVAYLRSNGHTRVGVLAEEDAATAAIQATIMHQGIDSLALVAPSADWGQSLGQDQRFYDPRGTLGRLYWRVAAGLRLVGGPPAPPLVEAIRFVSPTPVLLAGCKTEDGSTIDQLHLAAGEPKSLIVLGGEGKPVNWTHFAEYYKAVEQWFDLTLKAPDPVVEQAP